LFSPIELYIKITPFLSQHAHDDEEPTALYIRSINNYKLVQTIH